MYEYIFIDHILHIYFFYHHIFNIQFYGVVCFSSLFQISILGETNVENWTRRIHVKLNSLSYLIADYYNP